MSKASRNWKSSLEELSTKLCSSNTNLQNQAANKLKDYIEIQFRELSAEKFALFMVYFPPFFLFHLD